MTPTNGWRARSSASALGGKIGRSRLPSAPAKTRAPGKAGKPAPSRRRASARHVRLWIAEIRALLWAPTAASVREATLTHFIDWLRRERALEFADYESLRRWSIWRPGGILALGLGLLRGAGIRSLHGARVLDRHEMPGARWFDGARLNYAEHILARAPRDQAALIAIGEDRRRREISHVGSPPGRSAPSASRCATSVFDGTIASPLTSAIFPRRWSRCSR